MTRRPSSAGWGASHQVVMIVRYRHGFFVEALVGRRILLCGLVVGAFVLTLAFSSRHDHLWRSDAALTARATVLPDTTPPPDAAAATHEAMPTPTDEVAPVAAATNPASAVAAPEPVRSEPDSMENGRMRDPRDPAAEHGSRSH
jgi:hypothetical protein